LHDLDMASRNVQHLTAMLEERSQDKESVQQERLQSVAAIQQWQAAAGALKREKEELNLKVTAKDRELTETRREVKNVIEKKKRLETELERLREHLLAVEEGYTQEALTTEERERELRRKLQSTEEALHVSSVQHSTTSQESQAKLEHLQTEVVQLRDQRDQLLRKLARVTQEHQSQSAAVDNLTLALEGFRREKENDLKLAQRDLNDR